MKPRVYVDVREERTGIPSMIEAEGVSVIKKSLSMGDYVIPEDIVIERKSVRDFAKSLYDGRLFEQARRLGEHYNIIIYIVEGSPRYFAKTGRAKQLYSALAALTIDYNARVVYTDSENSTALYIAGLAKRVAREGTRGSIILHKKPKISPNDVRAWQLYIVQSFPSIGPKTAEKVLEAFGSLEEFCKASMSELSRIPGMGEKKAEVIKRILATPYKRRQEKKTHKRLDDFIG